MGDTIAEECKENPRVRLQAPRGGPLSSLLLFLDAGTEPVKEQGCRPLTSKATRGAGQAWEGRNER